MKQIATLYEAIALWERMSVASRTAFVQWLAADSSVTLYTQEQVNGMIVEAVTKSIDQSFNGDLRAIQTASALVALKPKDTR